ncbi:MAG: AMP-binding protein [Treponema sp.]|jgi:long-chain acyl-CoA synthetase|nr:AMP-binding protein [Treponema sp.]
MLDYSEYIADWPDMPYPNFVAWLDDIAAQWSDETALLFRSGKQREFSRWSFSKYAEECRRIGRGLLAAGLRRGDRVILWAENCPEWMAAWMGTAIAGLVIVPVDYLVSNDECANIIKITKAQALFYSPRKQEFAGSAASKFDFVKALVCLHKRDLDPAQENAGTVFFESFGAGAGEQQLPAAADIAGHDPVSIVFTSGTTGFAKGVTLHHKGILANANAAIRSLVPVHGDMFLSVLPLHHTYPTCTQFISPLSGGIAVIIVDKLVGKVVIDAVRDGGVTHLIAVPLLFNKVKAAIEQSYNKLPGVVRLPLNLLRSIALSRAKKGRPEFGQAVFKFLRKKAGLGSVKLTVAGGGPLNPKTADFFDSLGFNIVNGYGMSENSPLISVNTPRHKNNASVGLPVKYTDVKILNPDSEGIGEIAVKSPSLMLGYFENEEATREVFTEDGYLLTGDLGHRDEQGFIFINGRKKNLIVSSGGKNIYPEEIETCFEGSRVVGDILVVGRKEAVGEQIFAVVVPNYEALAEDYPGREPDEGFIRKLVKNEIETVNRTLPGYKKIQNFILRKEEFEKNAQKKIRRFMYKQYENAVPEAD